MKRLILILLFMTSCTAFGRTELFHIEGNYYGEHYYTQPSPFEDEIVSIMPMIYYGNNTSKDLMSLNCHRDGDRISSYMFYDWAWHESVYFEFDNGVKLDRRLGLKKQSLDVNKELLELLYAQNSMTIHTHRTHDGWEKQKISLIGFTKAYEIVCNSRRNR